MADLGPGTMPRGKYPESPARAGSHAVISRTPTPGGMLHANLGLPRPPPRNFQPPFPQQPSKQTATAPPTKQKIKAPRAAAPEHVKKSPKPKPPRAVSPETARRRMTTPGHVKQSPNPPNPSCSCSCGGMRGWPVHRPTHAPATALKTNGNSAPIKPMSSMSFPSSAWECVPRSSASHSRPRNNSQGYPATPPNPKNKTSRAAAPNTRLFTCYGAVLRGKSTE